MKKNIFWVKSVKKNEKKLAFLVGGRGVPLKNIHLGMKYKRGGR